MAAAVRALTGQLVRVRDGGRPKARSCHTKKYLRSLSQATNFERLGVEFWKAARPAAGACRSCILEGKAPNFGERRGLRFCIGAGWKDEKGRGDFGDCWQCRAGAEVGGELPRSWERGEVAKQLTDASVRVHRVELMPAMPNCRRNCYQGKGVSLLKTPASFPPRLEANATFS